MTDFLTKRWMRIGLSEDAWSAERTVSCRLTDLRLVSPAPRPGGRKPCHPGQRGGCDPGGIEGRKFPTDVCANCGAGRVATSRPQPVSVVS